MHSKHDLYMMRCLELAQLAKGYTTPNPMVGAVLVHENRIIGEGWHHKYGDVHAEVDCLNSVKEQDRHLISESAMYVNLEPCAHYGKMPPCAVRLVQEQVKQVFIANVDPFEKVSGRGIEILQSGGIRSTIDVLKENGLWLNRRFFCFHQQKRPYIILKWAQTADGYIAPPDGSRIAITNIHSNTLVHKWRTEEQAIMVGYNTALGDNPALTARLWAGRQPLRLVLDRNLQLPHSHNAFNADAATWVINEQKDASDGHVEYIRIAFDNGLLRNILVRLHAANVLSLIVEGGALLLNSFIEKGLWDEARVLTGANPIQQGIAAPVLNNAIAAFETSLSDDRLSVFVNKSSAYPYVQGMML